MIAALLLAAWPTTAAEKDGKAYVYDARVIDPAPCTSKRPIELRLYQRGLELRLGLKNCADKPVKVLHSGQLQASTLELTPKAKSVEDDRAIAKYDATVYVHSFATMAGGEERIVSDATLRGGELRWGPFVYGGLPAGKLKVKVMFDAKYSEGFDQKTKTRVPIEGAVTGSFTSNEVTIAVP